MDLNVPTEFKHLTRNVNSGVNEFVKNLEDFVVHALIGVGPREAAIIRPFLKTYLDTNPSAQALSEFWSSMPSALYFDDGEFVRKFLTALLVRLMSEPYLTGTMADK